jgi:hypothetical protein
MTTYTVLEPLAYDRVYAPGETVEMEERNAGDLIKKGVVSKTAAAEAATKPAPAAELITLAKQAGLIEELDKLAEGETRKTVLDAIEARRKELA